MMDEITLLKRGRNLRKVVTGQTTVGPAEEPKEYTTVVLRSDGDGRFRIGSTMEIHRTFGEAAGLSQHWNIVVQLVEDGWVVQKADGPGN